MLIGVPKETWSGELRTALVPQNAKKFIELGMSVVLESESGVPSGFTDAMYEDVGVKITQDKAEVHGADILMRVRQPTSAELQLVKKEAVSISFLDPFNEKELVEDMAKREIRGISMEMVPRSTRAQKMDALSSQANLAGYVTVIQAAFHCPKIFPMMMTPAGTIAPGRVFIIGAGVAGLQAIATAKRLGARVEAFDTRPVVAEQVQSLGAKFVKIDLGETGQTDQGYAKELTPEQVQKQKDLQADVCARSDIVITTAQLFGRPAPKLIDTATIEKMKPGSVIFDMAVESGGNVEGSLADEVVIKNGVKIIGISNLASSVSNHASLALSNNFNHWITDFFNNEDSSINFDFDDEIIKSSVIVFNSKILNERFQ